MSLFNKCLLATFLMVVVLGCQNYFQDFSEIDSNEAYFVEAQKALNKQNYAGALEYFALMSEDFRAIRKVRYLEASSNAGLCGIAALDLIEAIDDIGTKRFFEFLLGYFAGKGLEHMAYCRNAENLVRAIGTSPTSRTGNENFLLVLSSMGKMGTILNASFDSDDDGTLDGAGTVDNDGHCDPAILANSETDELITGLANVLASLPHVGTDFGGDQLTAIDGICEDLATQGAQYDFCSVTNTSNATADHRNAMRAIVGSNDAAGLGVGNCAGDLATCFALCP